MMFAMWFAITVWAIFSTVYAIGCYVLGKWPWQMWHSQRPDMYDGKEPYHEWAAKMHLARATQMKEEEE